MLTSTAGLITYWSEVDASQKVKQKNGEPKKHMIKENKNATVTKNDQLAVAAQWANPKQAIEVQKLADKIIRDTAQVGKAYLELCLYVRKNAIPPKMVSAILTEKGFARSRVAEINRVSNAADDVFNKFAAGTIGFKNALDIARGNVVDVVAEVMNETPVETKAGLLEASEDSESEERENVGGGQHSEEETAIRTISSLCNKIAKLSDKLGIKREKRYKTAIGYVVTVSFDKKYKPAPAKSPVAPAPVTPAAE